MTFFSRELKQQQRLDFELLQFGPVILYHQKALLDRDIAAIDPFGYELRRLDLEQADIGTFHDLIASSLDFPGYYGRNLDALNDCLRELPYTFGSDVLLVLDAFDAFFRRHRDFAHGVLDMLCLNAQRNQLVGHTMLVLAQSADPAIELPEIGSMGIYWNPSEFLNKNRER